MSDPAPGRLEPRQSVARRRFGRLGRSGRSAAGSAPGTDRRSGAGRGRLATIGGWAILLLIAGGAAGAFLIGGTVRAAGTPANQTTGDDVSLGAALFQQSCAACHGPQGAGVTDPSGRVRGPNIQNEGAAAADFVLRTGRMPLSDPSLPMTRGAPAFTPDQIRAIVAFVAGLGNGPAIPGVQTDGADLAHGRALFTANCAACHAPTGAGDAVGGGFNAPSLSQASALDVAEAILIGPPPMPVFSTKTFSQKDVNDLAAYVQYLRNAPAPGGLAIADIGPVPEGFVAIVVGLGAVYLVVRFVGRRGRSQREDDATATVAGAAAATAPGAEAEAGAPER